MNDIIQSTMVYKTEKGTPVTDSLKVARVFGKQHKNVMQQVRNLLGSAENSAHKNWFYKSTYLDAQGKQQPLFVMNRDGFSLLAMSLTGEKALQFKVAFIDLFDKMEKAIENIEKELEERIDYFKRNDRLLEAQRIAERTRFDIEMMRETVLQSKNMLGRKKLKSCKKF